MPDRAELAHEIITAALATNWFDRAEHEALLDRLETYSTQTPGRDALVGLLLDAIEHARTTIGIPRGHRMRAAVTTVDGTRPAEVTAAAWAEMWTARLITAAIAEDHQALTTAVAELETADQHSASRMVQVALRLISDMVHDMQGHPRPGAT